MNFGSLCISKKSHGKRLFSTNQMAGNSKKSLCSRKFAHWAKRLFLNFLSKETVFKFPAIWLVENSLFHQKQFVRQNFNRLGTQLTSYVKFQIKIELPQVHSNKDFITRLLYIGQKFCVYFQESYIQFWIMIN